MKTLFDTCDNTSLEIQEALENLKHYCFMTRISNPAVFDKQLQLALDHHHIAMDDFLAWVHLEYWGEVGSDLEGIFLDDNGEYINYGSMDNFVAQKKKTVDYITSVRARGEDPIELFQRLKVEYARRVCAQNPDTVVMMVDESGGLVRVDPVNL